VDLNEYREQSLANWGRVAPGWEEHREWLAGSTGVVNEWLADKADPQPGQTVLDVAGGTGDLGLLVAERIGGEGRVILTDFAPEMVDAARREGEARGVRSVEYRVLDAERMELDGDSVDAVVCRFGYMLMADPATALRETRRVLRNGGPLAFSVWTGPERNPWAAVPAGTVVERGHLPPPEPGTPGIFTMGNPTRIRELVAQAGFGEPEIEEIAFDFVYADFDHLWETITRLAGGIAVAIEALPDDEREATRAAIMEKLEPYRQDDGSYRAPASTWGVLTR
jgi:SAM-dependent methyltransferase